MKLYLNSIIALIAAPILFVRWLLLNGDFGPVKAMLFVVTFFLFGSAFFFD